MKTIGIFTDNELIVLRTAIDIINDYEKAGVTVTKQTRTKFDLYVDFSDGTKVEWIKPNLNLRGHKVTDGYIDISTCSREAITNIILPCIMDIDKEPEIVIIDSNPSRKDYDLDTLIDSLEKIRLIKGNLVNIGFVDSEGYDTITGIIVDKDNFLGFNNYN